MSTDIQNHNEVISYFYNKDVTLFMAHSSVSLSGVYGRYCHNYVTSNYNYC